MSFKKQKQSNHIIVMINDSEEDYVRLEEDFDLDIIECSDDDDWEVTPLDDFRQPKPRLHHRSRSNGLIEKKELQKKMSLSGRRNSLTSFKQQHDSTPIKRFKKSHEDQALIDIITFPDRDFISMSNMIAPGNNASIFLNVDRPHHPNWQEQLIGYRRTNGYN
eukprot:TRINITY_DN9262_c0_g1_i1.p1 TRINITY_DN9262_c0_g1~~TRINITY_DN9262_c0_g1_i1.p1  ORF type:complete len:163 (-),score=41.17 TRINITY_DN9262_c0_g1_i1:62-550(-)